MIPRPAHLQVARLSANARTVLEKRYLMPDEMGVLESPEDMLWRVAMTVASVDTRYGATSSEVLAQAERFYNLMAEGRFMPNSPTLMNAGRPLGQLSACFVLPIDDAIANGEAGIYDTLRSMAVIHQSGGGTGFSFSRLRPRGAKVRSTTGVASGPVSFMELYDASTDAVKQGGTRRGANMAILRCDHPDIEEFIACKKDLTRLTNFNISVAVTDQFMRAVQEDTSIELVDPKMGHMGKFVPARRIWNSIIEGAWATGEPGVFFIDQANRYNPVPRLGSYEATNPCGEQPLLPYDVCNLGSMNVGFYSRAGRMDWDYFREDCAVATHFLDNVIDANKFPLAEITQLSKRIRRIGLGVMGFADALIDLGIPYDTEDAVVFGRKVMETLDASAKDRSAQMSETRGTFPEWAQSIWGPDDRCARGANGERIRPHIRLRNCNVSTVAPTGTISIIAGCSSGLEPLFAVAFMRNQAGVMMPEVNDRFLAISKREGWYSDALIQQIAETGHINHRGVPPKWRNVFRTANNIGADAHVRMQAAFQEFCDSAISKTINFPQTATIDEVRATYETAFALGCKGITVYRDGSRSGQVLSTGATTDPTQSSEMQQVLADLKDALEGEIAAHDETRAALAKLEAAHKKRQRPDGPMPSTSIRKDTPLGVMFVHVTQDENGDPFEVFINLGKAGGSAMADAEAVGRLISLALRSGIDLRSIIKQLRGISSDRTVGFGKHKVLSMPDAIGQALNEWDHTAKRAVTIDLEDGSPLSRSLHVKLSELADAIGLQPLPEPASVPEVFHGACPDCGSQPEHAEGCMKCHVCGFSECVA